MLIHSWLPLAMLFNSVDSNNRIADIKYRNISHKSREILTPYTAPHSEFSFIFLFSFYSLTEVSMTEQWKQSYAWARHWFWRRHLNCLAMMIIIVQLIFTCTGEEFFSSHKTFQPKIEKSSKWKEFEVLSHHLIAQIACVKQYYHLSAENVLLHIWRY